MQSNFTMTDPDIGTVGTLVFFGCFFLTAELLRRFCYMTKDLLTTYNQLSSENSFRKDGESLPANLQICLERVINPWFDRKFAFIWIVCIVITIALVKGSLLHLSHKFMLPFIAFQIIYLFSHDKLMLSPSFIENDLTDGTNHIGPGLAVCWFSVIENILLNKDKKLTESMRRYKGEEAIGGGDGVSEEFRNGYFVTDRPLILCPDLASYIQEYEKYLEKESGKWNVALLKGIIKIDQILRNKNGERQWLFAMATNVSYPYEVSGTRRDCELSVFNWKDNRDPKMPHKYFSVIDNRPLDSMRKWYHDQKGRLSINELKVEYELFVETLRNLLSEDIRLKNKYYLLTFSGPLSKELIAFEEIVLDSEKIPIGPMMCA